MAIYEINGARYEIDDTNLTKQQLDGAIEEIAAQPQDSALGYSVDQLQMMMGKGAEALGDQLGFEGLKSFGSNVVDQQQQDIARGNYQAQYAGSLLEQDSIGDAAGWLLEGMQANAASGGFALAGTAAAAVAGLVSAPAALLLGGATLAGSFLMGTGESALEQEEKTGSYDSSVALGTGAIIGFLDRFGAGRVFSPSELGKMSVKELYENLAKKGYTEAAKEVAKEIGKKAAAEGVTEATQEGAIMGSAASQGGQYTAGEVGNRLVDAAALGTGFGGTAATAQTAVQGAAQAAGFAKSSTQRQADNVNGAAAALLERGMETGDQALIDKANEIGFAVEAAKNGDTDPLKKLAIEEEAALDPTELAKASFAHRLNEIIEDGPAGGGEYDVDELNVESQQGSRALVEAAQQSIAGRISELKGILKQGGTLSDGTQYAGLDPKNANTFDEVMKRVEAMVAVKMSKNKVKKSITNSQLEKIIELVGDTQEGKELVNLIRESLVMTDVHNQGYVGGLSQFTEKLNPLAPTGSYNTSAQVQAAVRTALTAAGAAGTGGLSLLAQAGVVGFGRFYDSLTGERSSVGKFITDNETGNRLPEPGPPSIIEDQAAVQQRQEQAAAALQPIMDQQEQVSGGAVAQIMDVAQGRLNIPITKQDYDTALDGLIERITDPQAKQIFQDIKDRKYGDQMPQEAMAILTQEIMANKEGDAQAAQNRQRESQEAMIAMAQRMAIEQGKADNRAAVNQLLDQLSSDNVINKGHKAQLQSALSGTFLRDLGRNPMATVENTVKDLQDNGVPQEAIDTYIMPYAQRVAGQQDARPQEFTEESSTIAPPTFEGKTPTVAGQSTAGTGNKHQLAPHLRIKVAPQREGKPLFTQKTNNKNADVQIDAIDEVVARHPNATSSPEAWGYMMSDALADGDVPAPPYKLINDLNDGTSAALIGSLTPGQIADADQGFENARTFRELYTSGQVPIDFTGKLFLWSFLSRGVSPYVQEGMFLDAYDGISEWIEAAADGSLGQRLPAFEKWAKTAAPKGSGQPGAGSTHNLNAFGKTFLIKMSQDAGLGDGRSRLQVIHDMMSDPNTTGQQVRREFLRMGEGVGIDNKVVSFTLLVAGYDDVMVIDRVQLRNMWNDGRFEGINLWDGYKVDGKPVTGSELSKITYGARGLLVYEAAERAVAARIDDIYAAAGRPGVGSVGRYHWETWVASSQQEASHATIDAILEDIKGSSEPLLGVTSKEGEYGSYAYGAQYGVEDGGSYFLYSVPGQGTYKFSVDNFVTFLDEIKKPRNGVVPRLFKVTESGNAPWFTREGVSIDALNEQADKYGTRLQDENDERAISDADEGQDVPDRSPAYLSDASEQQDLPGILSEPVSSAQPAQPVQEEVVVPTVRQVAAQEENAKPIFEVGKPGSPFENGIKKRADLERLAKALGIVFGTVKSMAAMERESGIKNKSGVTTMGGANISRYGTKPPSMILMEPGFPKRSKNKEAPVQSKDGFITTLAHEIAHFLEALPMFNRSDNTPKGVLSAYDPEVVRSPLTLNQSYVQPTSFRQLLLDSVRYAKDDNKKTLELVRLGLSSEDAKLILEEITNLQDFGNINIDIGNGTIVPSFVRGPFGADPDAFADASLKEFEKFKQEQIEAGASPADFVSSRQYRISAIQAMTKHRNNYIRNPAEFAVDPIWVYMVDPKFAKETMPTTAEFIRKLLNNAAFSKDTLQFYSSPIATMVAAALAILAANGGEEPEEQPLPRGALSPQGQGALSVI